MTGFGIARGKVGNTHIVVEARSVNHRFCEVNLRFPGRFSRFEPEVVRKIRQYFSRGKFDLFLREEAEDREKKELALVKKSHQFLRKIQKELRLSGEPTLSDLLACRNTFSLGSSSEDSDVLRRPLLRIVDEGMKNLRQMRGREGAQLQRWFVGLIRHLGHLVVSLEKQTNKMGENYRKKIQKQQLLQGEALLKDRGDVTEELVRLKSHLQEFRKQLHHKEPIGRKLEFLAQEMGREINTIGSKSQGIRVTHQAIEFKSALEQIREQVQNVE